MKAIRTVVGVDTAKRVFQLHWVDPETGEMVDRRLSRAKFLEHFANRAACVVGMEACGGSQHWARRLRELGHEVRLVSAKMVRAFVGGNKNDAADARAIWTAVRQPGVKTVAVKSEEQQAVLALHRMRQQLVKFRTAQINGLRGLLSEYGEVMPCGRGGMKRDIAGVLERLSERLPAMVVETLREQWARVAALDAEVDVIEQRLEAWHRDSPASQRVAAIPGVGVAERDRRGGHDGRSGRLPVRAASSPPGWVWCLATAARAGGCACWGISKRGDAYLRTLLIHGARSALTNVKAPPQWQLRLASRHPLNVAAVALANKTARTAWALLAHDREYNPNFEGQRA